MEGSRLGGCLKAKGQLFMSDERQIERDRPKKREIDRRRENPVYCMFLFSRRCIVVQPVLLIST